MQERHSGDVSEAVDNVVDYGWVALLLALDVLVIGSVDEGFGVLDCFVESLVA